MAIERESLPELTKSRTILESKLSSAQDVLDNIATLGYSNKKFLKLDPAENIDIFVDNLDRVTAVQEKLKSASIPKFQGEFDSLNQSIESLASEHIDRLNVLRERYKRIQSRMEGGLQVAPELLVPITSEIQKLEEIIFSTGRVEVTPVELEHYPAVLIQDSSESSEDQELDIQEIITVPDESEFAEQKVEEEKLPLTVINRRTKEISRNGEVIKFKDLQCDALMAIVQAGESGISTKDLDRIVKKNHPDVKSSIGVQIQALRRKIEKVETDPKFITSALAGKDSRYFFNGEVQFAPSSIVFFEGLRKVFVDNREVVLTQEEIALFKMLSEKVGEFVISRTLSLQVLGEEDPVAARLKQKMADLAKKINYPYGDKLITSKMASRNSGYKLQNVELASVEETNFYAGRLMFREILIGGRKKAPEETLVEESEEEKRLKVLANIAEIQSLIDAGILSNPEQIAKAFEMIRKLGGTIEYKKDQTPEDKKSNQDRNRFEIKEETLIVLSMILENPSDLKVEELIKVMGNTRKGKAYTWPQVASSIHAAVQNLATRIKVSQVNEQEVLIWGKIKTFVNASRNRDPFLIRRDLDQKIRSWFREKNAEQTAEKSLKNQVLNGEASENVGESDLDQGVIVINPLFRLESELEELDIQENTEEQEADIDQVETTERLSERQVSRQQLFTNRVKDILVQFDSLENFPQTLSASRITNIAKHELGVAIEDRFMELQRERGYVRPIQGEGHHVTYSQKDFVILVYIKRYGNNMSKIQKKELFKIIESEYYLWLEKRSKK